MIEKFPYMEMALAEAEKAAAIGEVPIGAVVVSPGGEVLAAAHNRVIIDHDPTAHAEILAIRAAAQKLKSERLSECDLYVTLEPCAMCAQAIAFARVRRLYFGAEDPKGGGTLHGSRVFDQKTCNHRPEIYSDIAAEAASKLLRDFFTDRR